MQPLSLIKYKCKKNHLERDLTTRLMDLCRNHWKFRWIASIVFLPSTAGFASGTSRLRNEYCFVTVYIEGGPDVCGPIYNVLAMYIIRGLTSRFWSGRKRFVLSNRLKKSLSAGWHASSMMKVSNGRTFLCPWPWYLFGKARYTEPRVQRVINWTYMSIISNGIKAFPE